MNVSSPAFGYNQMIPQKFTCLGKNINPSLEIKDIPSATESLVLIVDDPDAPGGTWVHWVVYDIPVSKTIKENSIPGVQGMNDFKRINYGGPCPPSGIHRYYFKLYALDRKMNLPAGKTKNEIEASMQGHIIANDELIGLFQKK